MAKPPKPGVWRDVTFRGRPAKVTTRIDGNGNRAVIVKFTDGGTEHDDQA